MHLEILSGHTIKPGDTVVGIFIPDAPTTPVIPLAAGLVLESVRTIEDSQGRPEGFAPTWRGGLTGGFLPLHHRLLVIRD